MRFTVLNWNIGGAKFLETRNKAERNIIRKNLNRTLADIIKERAQRPDVITFQEVVRYKEPNDVEIQDILDPLDGYVYFPFPLIDCKLLSSRAKWNKVMENSDWNSETYFAQGNAFLVKKDSPVFPVWDLSNLEQPTPFTDRDHFVEHVHLDSGLYFGDRNTEPRAALVMHFIFGPNADQKSGKPVDIFVVNTHLTTLMKEREGVPEIDSLAERTRLSQLDIIFNGIVSRYNSWRQDNFPERGKTREPRTTEDFKRHSPIWILAGDFNFTEESVEYAYIKRRNFIDAIPTERKESQFGKGTKAKGVGNDATLTLDYIFAGPKFVSLDPMIEEKGLRGNEVIHDHIYRVSDHYPVYAKIDFIPL